MADKSWTERDIPDQQGRVAVVTGANSGLGFVCASALAAKGATVIMACRSQTNGDQARARILQRVPGVDVRVLLLDTSDLQSVRACAERTVREFERIDLLLNNAGIMAVPRQKSKDGFELQLATNHLGHFALTGLLLPRLGATPGSRVVAVSSIAARSGRIDFDDLMGERKYDTWKAYNQSKLANLMFALELQRRLQSAGMPTTAYAAHPGGSTTNLFATPGAGFVKRVMSPLMGFMFQPAEQGALPQLHAATAPEAKPGGYYGPGGLAEMKGPVRVAPIPRQALDEAVAQRLWKVSEELTGVSYL